MLHSARIKALLERKLSTCLFLSNSSVTKPAFSFPSKNHNAHHPSTAKKCPSLTFQNNHSMSKQQKYWRGPPILAFSKPWKNNPLVPSPVRDWSAGHGESRDLALPPIPVCHQLLLLRLFSDVLRGHCIRGMYQKKHLHLFNGMFVCTQAYLEAQDYFWDNNNFFLVDSMDVPQISQVAAQIIIFMEMDCGSTRFFSSRHPHKLIVDPWSLQELHAWSSL